MLSVGVYLQPQGQIHSALVFEGRDKSLRKSNPHSKRTKPTLPQTLATRIEVPVLQEIVLWKLPFLAHSMLEVGQLPMLIEVAPSGTPDSQIAEYQSQKVVELLFSRCLTQAFPQHKF